VGFFDIESVPVEPERDLKRVFDIFDFLTRKTFPEIISDKETGSYAEERDEKESEFVHRDVVF